MNMIKRFLCCAAWVAVLAVFASIGCVGAWAQEEGSISGTITDSSGAAIKGATVELINTDRGATIRTLTTNSAGFYTATSLPLGTYTVHIVDGGFKTVNVTGVVLHVSDNLTVNRALSAGGASEVVTITADEARVNLEDATAAGLINGDQINQLVMITRNYESLINLQPGVAFGGASDQLNRGPNSPTGGSSTVAFSINGGRTTSNNWTIDGADNLDRGANLTLYTYPSPDAIAEFKTLRGQYSAQFGRNASGQIDVVTKSGTNSIHGSAYEYLRNDYFDANGFLNNSLHHDVSRSIVTTTSASPLGVRSTSQRSMTAATRRSSSSLKSGSAKSPIPPVRRSCRPRRSAVAISVTPDSRTEAPGRHSPLMSVPRSRTPPQASRLPVPRKAQRLRIFRRPRKRISKTSTASFQRPKVPLTWPIIWILTLSHRRSTTGSTMTTLSFVSTSSSARG